MPEADYEGEYEISGFKRPGKDTRSMYLKATLAEHTDRRRLLDMFHEGVVQKLVGLHLSIESLKYPDSITAEVRELKELVSAAIGNARMLANEIAPHVLFTFGLEEALYELFKGYHERFGICYYINMEHADHKSFDETTKLVIYNLIKRLLAGAVCSNNADTIGISVQTVDSVIEIVMEDNGCSCADFEELLSPGNRSEDSFLLEAAEQVSYLGGSLWIDRSIGASTVCAAIPLRFASQA